MHFVREVVCFLKRKMTNSPLGWFDKCFILEGPRGYKGSAGKPGRPGFIGPPGPAVSAPDSSLGRFHTLVDCPQAIEPCHLFTGTRGCAWKTRVQGNRSSSITTKK